jgi:hypothetical protein
LPYHQPDDYKDQQIPSWSWMICSAIGFLETGHKSYLMIANLRYDASQKEMLLVRVHDFEKCKVKKHCGSQYHIVDNGFLENEVGSAWFDAETNRQLQNLVVVGMEKEEDDGKKNLERIYYILIVRSLSSERYERIGVGKIQARYVHTNGRDGKLV